MRREADREAGAARGERGAALIGAVLLAVALAILAGVVGWFALVGSQTTAAARDHAEVVAAAEAALEIAAGALAREPDLAAVRLGVAVGPGATASLLTRDGAIDVATLTRRLTARRRRLSPPADVAVWRAYMWGRLGELAPTLPSAGARDPLVVVWVRADDGEAAGPDRLELAVEAVAPSGARAAAVAAIRHGPRGVAVLAVWPEAGIAGAG